MVLALRQRSILGFLGRWKLYRVQKKVRKVIIILVSVVLGTLLLVGLYALFNLYVIPELSDRIESIFDYTA